MRILLLGGTGTAGRSTLPALLAAGHTVSAMARSEAAASRLEHMGAEVVRCDARNATALRSAVRGHDVVIDHRVALPATTRAALPGAWRAFRYLRDQATGELVDAMITEGVGRLVRDLVTFVYTDGGDRVLEEDSPVYAAGPMAANLASEAHLARLTAAGGEGIVLRCGLFYGPHDQMSAEVVSLARRGVALIVGPAAAWHSALHTDDIGSAVLAGLSVPAGVYNVTDAEPMRRGDLVALLAECAGRTRLRRPPGFVLPLTGAAGRAQARSQRVSTDRYRALTGWQPAVSSRRQGWPEIFRSAGRN